MQDNERTGSASGSIALVAAMQSELRHAMERLFCHTSRPAGPFTIHDGSLHGRHVVAMATGIGMVNAGAATSLLLASERPSLVLNFGCAGAHRDDIHPGDVVIGEGVVNHLSLTILPNGEERYAGFRFQVDDRTILTDVIPADRDLFDLACDVARDWGPDPWPWSVQRNSSGAVHAGIIASADCWTQDPVRIGGLHDLHGSLCEDMEAAAVAQVCAIFKTPMLAIKDISNNELHASTGHAETGPTLETVAAEVGARAFALVERIVQRLDAPAPA